MVQQLVFYTFAALVTLSGIMVVFSKSSVQSALFLVMAFVASSVLWMLLEAEFLSLVLIFVYVGAVMTLFLFVVMMLDLDNESRKSHLVKYLPLGIILFSVMVGLLYMTLGPGFGVTSFPSPAGSPAGYSNTKELGAVLYTQFAYPFELCAVLLLVAIISAISLAFRGKRNRKAQNVPDQIDIDPATRVRLVTMATEKPLE